MLVALPSWSHVNPSRTCTWNCLGATILVPKGTGKIACCQHSILIHFFGPILLTTYQCNVPAVQRRCRARLTLRASSINHLLIQSRVPPGKIVKRGLYISVTPYAEGHWALPPHAPHVYLWNKMVWSADAPKGNWGGPIPSTPFHLFLTCTPSKMEEGFRGAYAGACVALPYGLQDEQKTVPLSYTTSSNHSWSGFHYRRVCNTCTCVRSAKPFFHLRWCASQEDGSNAPQVVPSEYASKKWNDVENKGTNKRGEPSTLFEGMGCIGTSYSQPFLYCIVLSPSMIVRPNLILFFEPRTFMEVGTYL